MTGRRRTDTSFHFRPSLPAMPLSELNDVSFLHCPKAVHVANKHVDGNTHCSGTMTTGTGEECKKGHRCSVVAARPVSLPAVLWQTSVFVCSIVADQCLCLHCRGKLVSLPAVLCQTSVFACTVVANYYLYQQCCVRPASLPALLWKANVFACSVLAGQRLWQQCCVRPASLPALSWKASVFACSVLAGQ